MCRRSWNLIPFTIIWCVICRLLLPFLTKLYGMELTPELLQGIRFVMWFMPARLFLFLFINFYEATERFGSSLMLGVIPDSVLYPLMLAVLILTKYGDLPKGVRPHADRIFPAAAIYLTIKEELGEKTAYSVIENAAINGCARIAQKLQKLMKVPGMQSLFVCAWDPMTKRIFGPDNGFKNVFYPKKKGEYRMDIISCPYYRYFTEVGCPELTKIFCENDERIYGNLPGLKFERKGTLGKGAERCDFHLQKEQPAYRRFYRYE